MFRKLKALFMLTGLLCCISTLPAWSKTPVPRRNESIKISQRTLQSSSSSKTFMRVNKSSSVKAGDVIVVMKDSQAVSSSLSSDSVRISAQTARINSVASSVNASVKRTYPALSSMNDNKIFALVHSDSKSETQLLNELRSNPDVIGVSLNYKVFAFDSVPNDTRYSELWGLQAVKANKLWDKGYTGSNNVYVAVIDTGINYNHEDLSANFDSSYSENFVSSSSSYNDLNGHGTHVAGTIAAVGNNSKGVTGINWTAKVIALKALGDDGSGDLNNVLEALNDLSGVLDTNPSMNVAAVNLSLGYYASDTPSQMISNNDAMWLAFDSFSKKNRAVLCVAAGNENIKIGEPVTSAIYENGSLIASIGDYCYPASFKNIDNMIVVAASNNDSSYSRASFSNYSTQYTDIAAPGVNILSTYPNNQYVSYNGTSMASPHVAGAAALLKSIVPGATASQIKNAIIQGANKNYAKDYTRYGFLDIESALGILQGTASPSSVYISGSFSNGTAGTYYSSKVTAYGASSYSWSCTGSIPDGLKFSYSGNTATLYGTPSRAGTYSFTLKVSSGGVSSSKNFSVTISPKAQKIAINNTFSVGKVGVNYSRTVTASGGTSPYYWSYTGTLPPGLGLYYTDSKGSGVELYGTPYYAGTYKFTLYAEDYNYNETSKTFTVTISSVSKPSLSGTLSNGVKGKYYNQSLKVTGGVSPYSWSYTGNLPSGLNIYSSGASLNISGTPTSSGTYSFTINASDSAGSSVSKSFTISISNPSSTLKLYFKGKFKNWYKGKSYSDNITFGGGTKPYKLTYTGKIPDGLKLKLSGTKIKLSGKPTKAGKYRFKIKLTDNNNAALTKSFTVNIAKNAPAFSGNFTAGTVGSSYNSTVNLTGGTKPYKLTYTGKLPKGLKLSKSGTKARLKGKPSKKGNSRFKIKLTDKNGVTVNKTFTVKITQAASAKSLKSLRTQTQSLMTNAGITANGGLAHIAVIYTAPERIKLRISDEDILESGSDKDSDLFKVKANKALAFIIEDYQDLEDVIIFLDFKPYEYDLEISDDGVFTLPAELVHDDFVVSVKAKTRSNNHEAESEELYISAE
ncbi:MAG: S8 family serine peptidase [Synergistaceae bacterium]|nr:S8 family serine peptidase [Synergistaceae bacterium]